MIDQTLSEFLSEEARHITDAAIEPALLSCTNGTNEDRF